MLHGVGIEHREKTEQVTHAVEWHAVEYDEVLVGTAPAHIQARGTLASRLHTGHELQALQKVDLPADGRQPTNLVHGNFDLGHLDLVLNAVEPFTRNHRFLDGDPGDELEIHFRIAVKFDFEGLGSVSDV